MHADFVFAVLGTLASAIQYLAPIGEVLQMRERGNSTGVLFLPYVLMSANTLLWSCYGIIRGDLPVLVSSVFGFVCGVSFSITHYSLIRRPSVKACCCLMSPDYIAPLASVRARARSCAAR